MVRIGIIGYSAQDFNKLKAREIINNEYDNLEAKYGNNITIVSGYTALGIPKIAYELADERGWKTVGVACKKAQNFETYNVDKRIIEGEDWGDESDEFLNRIDLLLKVGGGEQSKKEIIKARKNGIKILNSYTV